MDESKIESLFTRFSRYGDRQANLTGLFRLFFIEHPEIVEVIRNADGITSIEFRKFVLTVLSGNPISLADTGEETIVLESRSDNPKMDFMLFPKIPKRKPLK